ncbi:MAG: arginine--tRNA ligase, partial [Geobacter sp.]
MIRHNLATLVSQALERAREASVLLSETLPAVTIGTPAHEEHGDFSCNVAMQLAKAEKKAPRQVAELLLAHLEDREGLVARTEIAGP